MRKKPEICRYCGGSVVLTDPAEIYENGLGNKIYLCRSCNAYVRAASDLQPLGTLANAALRMKRREAHRVFDAWRQARGLTRRQAYRKLAVMLHLPLSRAHIGLFEIEDCDRLLRLCRTEEKGV